MMASNVYHFEDRWRVPFPVESVWEVFSRPEDYPLWWRDVYLSARPVQGADQPLGERSPVAVVARGWLPYKLHFTIETVALRKPDLIEFKASGDFVTDGSRWLLKPGQSGTFVTLDWNPRVEKPLVKFLSPVLKPLFRWNHEWTMRQGERQISEYLAEKKPG
jgi:uncharacterized protein YndB with AHSA1/START domain